MFRHTIWMLSCLSMLSLGLIASTDHAENSQNPAVPLTSYKAKIVMGVNQALTKKVKASSKAIRSSQNHQKQPGCSSHHHFKKSNCCEATVISSYDINPNGYVIDEPGVYRLKESTVFHSKTPGAIAIFIDSDNVTLDLCENTLLQKNETTGTIGVAVNGRENVVVENGCIQGFKKFGVHVTPQSSYVTLQQLNVLENGTNNPSGKTISGGISITSGLPSSITHDIFIKNVTSSGNFFAGLLLSGVTDVDVLQSRFNNNTSATTNFGINSWGILATAFLLDPTSPSFLPCSNLTILDCEANSNNGAGGSIGIEVLSVPAFGFAFNNNVVIERCIAHHNIGGGSSTAVNEGEGIVIAGTQNFVVKDCVANGNASAATQPSGSPGFYASTGFGVPFYGINGLFENCVAEGNSGAGDTSQGFRILRSTNITVSNCVASGNNNTSTGEAWGFNTDPLLGNDAGAFGPPVNRNFIIQNCVAEGNNAPSNQCGGFKFVSQVYSILANCRSVGNGETGSSNGIGILVSDPPCCITNNCCTVDPAVCNSTSGCLPFATCCVTLQNIIHNNEVAGNTLYGIRETTNTNPHNNYYANIARGNGTNYSNLPAGTPIRIWGPPPAFPQTTDNNGVLDAQLDNIDIRS